MIETKEQPKQETPQVVGKYFHPDTLFTLTVPDMAKLETALAPFAFILNLINQAKGVAGANGNLKSAYETDFKKNDKGEYLVDDRGAPILRDDFWVEETKPSNSLKINKEGVVEPATN